jgi:uncharacterized protein YrzB (UPF0473 family)
MADENNNEQDIVVLVDPNGKEVKFEFVDVVERDDKMYAVLHPVEQLEGMEEDSCVIFRMEIQDDDSVLLNAIEDENEVEAVYEQYVQLCESDCDCDDECEGGECNCGSCGSNCDCK